WGCGTGLVLAELEQVGVRTCVLDMHIGRLRDARARIVGDLLCGNSLAELFPPEFETILLCDVIEHVDDDVALLQNAGQALIPGGHLVLTVPALPQLWTAVDDASGHKR